VEGLPQGWRPPLAFPSVSSSESGKEPELDFLPRKLLNIFSGDGVFRHAIDQLLEIIPAAQGLQSGSFDLVPQVGSPAPIPQGLPLNNPIQQVPFQQVSENLEQDHDAGTPSMEENTEASMTVMQELDHSDPIQGDSSDHQSPILDVEVNADTFMEDDDDPLDPLGNNFSMFSPKTPQDIISQNDTPQPQAPAGASPDHNSENNDPPALGVPQSVQLAQLSREQEEAWIQSAQKLMWELERDLYTPDEVYAMFSDFDEARRNSNEGDNRDWFGPGT
jgi:hypothetical protein